MIKPSSVRLLFWSLCLAAITITGFKAVPVRNQLFTKESIAIDSSMDPKNMVSRTVHLKPDTSNLIRNPMTGWAIYATAGTKGNFWTRFDQMSVPSLQKNVRASDYANILYIRLGWSDFEPTEGNYAWEHESIVKMLIDGAEQRGLKLAFRINVDSRDKSAQCTPLYVQQAGAKGFTSRSGEKVLWSPYPDDVIFQQKYEKFLKAFAAKFNNPDKVDFIDGYGLGKWGESHSVLYLDQSHRGKVFDWITSLYLRYFTKVPLAINYHRLIGTPGEWGNPDMGSKQLLDHAFSKGFMLRHDAFGMTDYYKEFEKNIAAQWFPERPVIAEGGWLHNGKDSYLKDSRGFKNWGQVWKGEYDDAVEAHVNVMDLRGYADASSWFETSYPLIEKFIAIGGYRLYPDQISLPIVVKSKSRIRITHRWNNLGIGMCPTNLPQWHQKYKVAFALLDKKNLVVKSVFVDYKTDLSKWLKGSPTSYSFNPAIGYIAPGGYVWAVAIVDTTQGNKKGINLAVSKKTTRDGWLPLLAVTVQ